MDTFSKSKCLWGIYESILHNLYPPKHMFGATFNIKVAHFSLAIIRMAFRNSISGEPIQVCLCEDSRGGSPRWLKQVIGGNSCLGSDGAVQPHGCHQRFSARGHQSVFYLRGQRGGIWQQQPCVDQAATAGNAAGAQNRSRSPAD